jgi:hypothetical protein
MAVRCIAHSSWNPSVTTRRSRIDEADGVGALEGGVKSGVKTCYILLHRCASDTTEDTRNTTLILHFVVPDPFCDRNGVQGVVGSNPTVPTW